MAYETESQDEEKSLGGSYLSLRAEGNRCYLKGQYYDAIHFFTRALEIPNSGHIDCDLFIRRGWCHLQLANTREAFKDVTEAQVDAEHAPAAAGRVLLLRAEVLYATGEFEKALVHFSRGHAIKPSCQKFVLGINKCREAITNAVGGPERIKLSLKGDLSHFDYSNEGKKGIIREQTKQLVDAGKPASWVPNEKTIKQLLADIYHDKTFLDKMQAEAVRKMQYDEVSSAAIDETLTYLGRRTCFWQKQNPIYSQSHEKRLRERRRPCAVRNCTYLDQFLSKELQKVQIDMNNGNLNPSLCRAARCISMIDNIDSSIPINRSAFKADVHGLIGKIHFEANQLRKGLKHSTMSKELAMKSGVKSCMVRALENLAKIYMHQQDYEKTVEMWIEKLDLTEDAEEQAWLCHDIGRCYMELGQYTEVLEYGGKALLEVTDSTDKNIQLSIKVLMAQAHAKLGDYDTAREMYGAAMTLAQYLGTRTTKVLIQEALEKVSQCVEVARSALEISVPHSGVSVVISKPSQVPKSNSKTQQQHRDSGE